MIASLSFLAVVIVIGKAFFPFFDEPEANGSLEAINWFATHDVAPNTKVYCTPNDQLTLTFLRRRAGAERRRRCARGSSTIIPAG